MAVSSGGGIQPSSDPSNWSPALQGKQAPGLSAPEESIFSETTRASSVNEENLVRSGSTGMYATETEINKAKYRKTQDRTSNSPKSRLRSTFSKMRASLQGFMSGFGSRASRVSAKRASDNGEGMSLLPTNMDVATKKGNRISPEMQGFFLDASGFGGSSSDISSLTLNSLQSSQFSSGISSKSSSSSEASSVVSFGSLQRALMPMNEQKVNAWTAARLGGEMISFLLDPNVETSSLVRRAMATVNEGMVDLSDLAREEVSTAMPPFKASQGKVKSSSSDSSESIPEGTQALDSNTLEKAQKEAEKKKSRDDITEDQIMLARAMASLLVGGKSGEIYSIDSSWFSPSTKFPAPKFSGTISAQSSGDKPKNKSLGIKRKDSQTHFNPIKESKPQNASIENLSHTENRYRFPREQQASGTVSKPQQKESTAFKNPENSSQNFFPVSRQSVLPIASGLGGPLGSDAVSSSYHFLTERGISLLAPTPRSTHEYKDKVEAHKGPGAPPDPLIYQYRNVAVEPPIILRSPQPFSGTSRVSVQGKPEASSVHDDSGGSGGFGDQRKGSSEKVFRQNKKGKKLSKDI
ncbi:hypothetical protein C10C_0302 [Chlamydia serpentis]|uniref:Uncharacterized protein n=1 Tax=Chlamydia serpentis TaxID=1967782 RepID=A0A2R8FAM8_9CHLA|nr:hypothetical protein [Chlamydia serpentis]SPN73475.1 hypothetical protein C10C_0302 [Chlamydia serpentis]